MTLLKETGYMPTHKYASGVEIRHYLNDLAKKFKLDDKVLFRAVADDLKWNESSNAWKVDLTVGRGVDGAEKSETPTKASTMTMPMFKKRSALENMSVSQTMASNCS